MIRAFVRVLVPVALSVVLAWAVVREMSRAWFRPSLEPELLSLLEQSLADQRELAHLSPETAPERRGRFERTQALLRRLRVLALSRDQLVRRHEALLLFIALGLATGAATLQAVRQGRRERRLFEVQRGLGELAAGVPEVRLGLSGRDLISRVARMIEEVSAAQGRDRRRLASLEDLSRWQEASRRHAHEMRTPLTGAQLELERLREAALRLPDSVAREEVLAGCEGLGSDMRRLHEFAAAFAAFGRLREPQLERRDLGAFLAQFVLLFGPAWPGLGLRLTGSRNPCPARFDPEQLRQVLVNLCDNAAGALREAGRSSGQVRLVLVEGPRGFSLDVLDDGPGLSAGARERLFQPYASFRPGGTGLGLAISRKILLDHGGDLELVASSETGTAFRLVLPASSVEAAA